MVVLIAEVLGKKVRMSRMAGILIEMVLPFVPSLQKAFGNLIYEGMELMNMDSEPYDFEKSIKHSVSGGST